MESPTQQSRGDVQTDLSFASGDVLYRGTPNLCDADFIYFLSSSSSERISLLYLQFDPRTTQQRMSRNWTQIKPLESLRQDQATSFECLATSCDVNACDLSHAPGSWSCLIGMIRHTASNLQRCGFFLSCSSCRSYRLNFVSWCLQSGDRWHAVRMLLETVIIDPTRFARHSTLSDSMGNSSCVQFLCEEHCQAQSQFFTDGGLVRTDQHQGW